jgi:hypothetical protein
MSTHKAPGLRTLARHVRRVDLDDGDAFLPDFRHGFAPAADGDVEALGEEFIVAATSAEAVGESARDELLEDELDGLSIDTPYDDVGVDTAN